MAFHLLGWGIPLILCIIAISTDNFGYETGYTYCFVSSSNGHAWMIGLWLVPIAITLVLGGGSLLIALIMIQKILNQVSSKKSKKAEQIILLVRMGIFLVIFWYFYVFVFAQLIKQESDRSVRETDLVEYFFCLFKGNNTASYCRDTEMTNDEEYYRLQMVSAFNLASQGLILCIIFLFWAKVWAWFFYKVHIVDHYTDTRMTKSRASSQVSLNNHSSGKQDSHVSLNTLTS